jgi:uncharacterized protein
MKSTNIFFIGLCFLLLSCKDKEKKEETLFQKKDILEQLANNWVIPNQNLLKEKVDNLALLWSEYLMNQTTENLTNVKNQFKSAYLQFQRVKTVDVGPSTANGFMLNMGTFPTDIERIQLNVSNGSYDLNSGVNYASIGFPALDYLLFHSNASTDLQNENYLYYISACISKMKSETDQLVASWSTYKNDFIKGTGTSSTDAFSVLVNSFCKDFEQVKTAKIGIPLGKYSLDIVRLEYIEAKYSGFSNELIIENLKSLKSVFLGESTTGTNGKGFDDYLTALEKTTLSNTIKNRFDELIARIQNWNAPFEQMLTSNISKLNDDYSYIQQTVVYLKTDMASSFGVLITYQDNDGD